LNYNFE
jgi:hypothetical protein